MKITVVCGNGLGTSLMMEMSIKSIVKDLGVNADVDHVDLGSAKGTQSDIFVGTSDIAEQLVAQQVGGKIVSLKNMVDKVAMKERIAAALTELGAL
ncbi:PTS ascorbate transporter subunit IIB [bacteria symbiont BFo1 of Frankliniella occidentalis]|jgi:PTS system ascorbate-specific IIB component|uniref:PTS sugar transporter subunit IIB n=1 Tax=Erwinia aphidicola TaxID=68334 RepID=A0ABU8DKQ3_ERWAP|nr:PTS sugar transporter subunit IIB [Erwinia aphidicola]KMV71292.1 PTS ascorbate transporter subunit IIB [bacteria symbiont BFo1 of Frankliniella occidentalis]PIJ60298.1 PTS ascorbate transporter subunit IIB [Erwinia sp. OLMDLW33]KYP85390.1 PTS ascorbate transporter subunit IIB [bacteria symbiont BFo1 of Frankliniella occidentalis]KYP90660.1 PTS ascorbate transporter subunit IIB [bacteria symbiont BFo1 of Frankliniella occidentalis]MBD1375479.1 PTS sugar transporter subunit IIB [Erwinia aphid